jgi:flagellar biosynthesis/type III secretory pathway M-ring protein FliF/YscJ
MGDSQLLMKMPSNANDYSKNGISIIEENEEEMDEEGEDFIDKKLSGQARKQLEEKTYVMEEIKDYVELKPLEAAQVVRALMTSEED